MFIYSKGKVQPFTGKVLFLGDSITDNGMYISYINAYLMLHQPESHVQTYNMGLSCETVCGLTEPGHPFPRPNVQDRLDRALLTVQPDWVFLMYGMNDGIYHPLSEERMAAYTEGLRATVKRIRAYGCRVVLMTPTPFEKEAAKLALVDEEALCCADHLYSGYDEVLEAYSRFIMTDMAEEVEAVIDLRSPLLGQQVTVDGIHPNQHGHWLIARTILREAMNVSLSKFDLFIDGEFFDKIYHRDSMMHTFYKEFVGHSLPDHAEIDTYKHTQMKYFGFTMKLTEYMQEHPEILERTSEWNGYERIDFYYKGYEVIVVKPHIPDERRSWVWRTEFFGAFPSVDLAMLEEGYHIVHFSVANQYGAPMVLWDMETFYYLIREKFELAETMIPFGFSRGGLYAMLLANAHPAWVEAVYLDAPVVDIRTWPKEISPKEWKECLAAWGYTEENCDAYEAVMQERIDTMVYSQMPLALVYGAVDRVVDYTRNSALLIKAYQNAEAMGFEAPCLIIEKPDCDHHPHSLDDPAPVVEFLTQWREEQVVPVSFRPMSKRESAAGIVRSRTEGGHVKNILNLNKK